MTAGFPEVGASVLVEDEDGGEHRSEIHSAGDGRISLIRLGEAAMGTPVLVGAETTVAWSAGDGAVTKVRARVTALRRDGESRVWDLDVLGEPWNEQRRAWVRVAASGPIVLTEIVDDGSPGRRSVDGELVDVSEVAARCVIGAQEVWAGRRNARLRARFSLGAAELNLEARVLSSAVSASDPDRRAVVIRFDGLDVVADAVRRQAAASGDSRQV